jgi:hypothetical protein
MEASIEKLHIRNSFKGHIVSYKFTNIRTVMEEIRSQSPFDSADEKPGNRIG